MSHEVPQRTWEKVTVDLLTQDQKDYLATVDYYSAFCELDRVRTTDSGAVVRKLKTRFARYGSPCQLVGDNGPQFGAAEFQRLLKVATIFTWDFLRYAILHHKVLAVAPLNGS